MHYFIGGSLQDKLTGIERALINRLNLFKEMHLEVRLIFTKPNPWSFFHAKKFGIEDVTLSVYDYFQGTSFEYKKNIHINPQNLFTGLHFIEEKAGIKYYDQNNNLCKYAGFHKDSSKLAYVNHLNSHGNLVSRDFYDSRGFINKTKYFYNGEKAGTFLEHYYTPNGEIKIEKYYHVNSKKEQVLDYISLNNYQGTNYRFSDDSELFSFFIDEIHKNGDIFYTDRHFEIDDVLGKKNVNTVSVLHNIHTIRNKTNEQIMTSSLTRNYRYSIEHNNQFKRIVVSTHKQKDDIQIRFPYIKNISVIPVAYLDNVDMKDENSAPNPLRLISVARYDLSKQLDHQLRLIKKLKKDFPNIELHMFGFGNRRYLYKLIEEMDIKENIFVRGFIKDIEPEYGKSILSLCTSSFEGFCLAVFESIKHNVPCISYDVRYGPNEIISDKVNGFLIEPNNEELLYLTVKNFLDTHGNNLSMDRSAFEESFSKEKVKNKWNALINSI